MELVVVVRQDEKLVEAKPLTGLNQEYVLDHLAEGRQCSIQLSPFQEAIASLKGPKGAKAKPKAVAKPKKRRKYKSPHEGKEAKILERRVEGKFVLRGKDFEVKHPSRGYLEAYCKRFKIKLVK